MLREKKTIENQIIELLNTRPEIIDHAVVASALCRNIPLMKFSHKLSIYKLTVAMLKVNWLLNFQVKQFKVPDKISTDKLEKRFSRYDTEYAV